MTLTTSPDPRREPDGGGSALFDITKQVWSFDLDDMTITVDGMLELCTLNGAHDFPCVEEPEEIDRLQDESEACGHAIAALPQLLSALQGMAALWDGVEDADLPDDVVFPLLAARQALARATPSPGPAGADDATAGGGA